MFVCNIEYITYTIQKSSELCQAQTKIRPMAFADRTEGLHKSTYRFFESTEIQFILAT